MNSRIQNFENLITRPDGSIDDIFSERQRELNELQQILTMNPQQAYQLSTSIQAQHDSLETGLNTMRKNFVEACSESLKEKPDPQKQVPYQNVLPYGLEKGEPNPQRTTLNQDVNASLENLDPSLTKNTHSIYTKIYHKMFPDTYNELKESIIDNYGDHSVKDIDGECLNPIFSSAVGSMFDWTSIDPKSVGMGSIEHITELFQKYYFGYIDDKGQRPWEEIRSDNRKYGANQELEIQGDKFYNDFINGFFFRSCVKGYVSKETKAPKDFKSKVEGFYDFNPDLWFNNKDPNDSTKFKPENNKDSYGNFFKVKQPVRILEARAVDGAGPNADPRRAVNYTAVANQWNTAVRNADNQINNYTGMYNFITGQPQYGYILTEEEKMVCCLFHEAAMRNPELVPNVALALRLTNTDKPLELLDFDHANKAYFGNGTDKGDDNINHNAIQGDNAPINKSIQLLYNSRSLGFHKTHGVFGAIADSSTLITNGGKPDIQMITGYSCGVQTGLNILVSTAAPAYNIISDGRGAATAGSMVSSIFTNAALTPTVQEITTAFSRNRFEFININSLMKGGNKVYKHKKISKVISKKKLPKKEKKLNSVKKVKKVQKGGARDNFFDITEAEPTGVNISLSTKRRDYILTKPIFENYRKAIKEYVKRFGKNASETKINDDIIQKINGIYHLGIFYHSHNKPLDFGGDGGGIITGPHNLIEFEKLGEIFLFCSVITNTIKLMIHFFNNIKECINHFINSDLEDIKKSINKQLKTVNSTNISSFNASYFDKYIDGCNGLIKNINNLVDFLRNNTMCLGKPMTNGTPPADSLIDNEQFVRNLFFGANIVRQESAKTNVGMGGAPQNNLSVCYDPEFYKFNHSIIDFFSTNAKYDFSHLNSSKFQQTLRRLTGYKIVLTNGFGVHNPATPNAFPKKDYSITLASFGGIPMTFQDHKSTQFSWMTFGFLLRHREKSNEKLEHDNLLEINQSLSQISGKDKVEIKKKVIESYKAIRPIIVDPKIDLGTKNRVLQKVFLSFFEESNKVAKKIIDDHSEMEKKSKRINIRSKITITNIVQRRSISSAESSRVLFPKEIEIQLEMRKYSYKVDCLINLLHSILISGTNGSMKNYIIFMYSISRLRNFVYRLYYLNKSYYTENEPAKKKLLADSGFDLSKNSKNQDKKKEGELFSKMIHTQLKDQNSNTKEWWEVMETSFRNRTAIIHGKYFRLFVYVLLDDESFLVDIFSMAKSEHSIKSYKEILKEKVSVYKDHHGNDVYSPDNMLIKLTTDLLTKDVNYQKLLKGELYYEYKKDGSNKFKSLEPLFIQGSTVNQLENIVQENHYIAPSSGRPENFIFSTKSETSLQIYKIQKHNVLHASAFRSWAYDLLFSMPTRIDVDDSYFKLHIQNSINTIPPLAKNQIIPSLKTISKINSQNPVVEFKSKVLASNNAKLLMNNNINNKRISSSAKYISREQIIMLGLVFGDSLH